MRASADSVAAIWMGSSAARAAGGVGRVGPTPGARAAAATGAPNQAPPHGGGPAGRPVAPQGATDPHGEHGLTRRHAPRRRRPQALLFGIQPLEPRRLL